MGSNWSRLKYGKEKYTDHIWDQDWYIRTLGLPRLKRRQQRRDVVLEPRLGGGLAVDQHYLG